jgi:hypothetical protein
MIGTDIMVHCLLNGEGTTKSIWTCGGIEKKSINTLFKLYCLRQVSKNQVFIFRKTCTCSFMVQCVRNVAVQLGYSA